MHVLFRCSSPRNTDSSPGHTTVTVSKQVHIRRERADGIPDAELVAFPTGSHVEEDRPQVAEDKEAEAASGIYDVALQVLGRGQDANEVWDWKGTP